MCVYKYIYIYVCVCVCVSVYTLGIFCLKIDVSYYIVLIANILGMYHVLLNTVPHVSFYDRKLTGKVKKKQKNSL